MQPRELLTSLVGPIGRVLVESGLSVFVFEMNTSVEFVSSMMLTVTGVNGLCNIRVWVNCGGDDVLRGVTIRVRGRGFEGASIDVPVESLMVESLMIEIEALLVMFAGDMAGFEECLAGWRAR